MPDDWAGARVSQPEYLGSLRQNSSRQPPKSWGAHFCMDSRVQDPGNSDLKPVLAFSPGGRVEYCG